MGLEQDIEEVNPNNQRVFSNQYFMGKGPRATRLKEYAQDMAFFDGEHLMDQMLAKIKRDFDFSEHLVDKEYAGLNQPVRLDDHAYQMVAAVGMLLIACPLREYESIHEYDEWSLSDKASIRYGQSGLRQITFQIPGLENKVLGHCYINNGITFKFDHLKEGLRLSWSGYMFKTAPHGLISVLEAFIRAKYPHMVVALPTEVVDEKTQVANRAHDAVMLLNQIYQTLLQRPGNPVEKMKYQLAQFCASMTLSFQNAQPYGSQTHRALTSWVYWVSGAQYQVWFSATFSPHEPKMTHEFKVSGREIVNHFLLMVLYEVTIQKLRRGVEHAKTFVYKPQPT